MPCDWVWATWASDFQSQQHVWTMKANVLAGHHWAAHTSTLFPPLSQLWILQSSFLSSLAALFLYVLEVVSSKQSGKRNLNTAQSILASNFTIISAICGLLLGQSMETMVPWTSTSTTHSTPLLLFAGASSVSSTGGSFSFSFLIFFNSCIFGPPAREAFLSALPQINWLMVKLVADNFKCFSPFSSCQIQESQQVRFKPCFSKRQCSFGQQPCPQPPASPESDTPFLCQKKCYRAVWFPPGDLPPSWGLKSRKSCAWNAQCDSFSKHTPLQEQINFIVTWNAKNYQLTKLIRQSVQKKPKRLMCENKKSPAHMANLWICTNRSPKG